MWVEEKAEYLAIFLSAAASIALPSRVELAERYDVALAATSPPVELEDRYDVAKVSTAAASHARERPPCHGMRVTPSGRRSEPEIRPVGFLTAGTSAHRRARQMTSFDCWCRVERLALSLQDGLCSLLVSTTLPHGQGWGTDMEIPSRNPYGDPNCFIALTIEESTRLVPH